MKGGTLLALALLSGCAKKQVQSVDADLPEKMETVAARAPTAILEDAAESLNPSDRGNALRFLVATSTEAGGGVWAERALFDPDAWVQRQGVIALVARTEEPLTRERLAAYILRPAADPYARGYGAVRLADTGDTAISNATREAWRNESEAWRRAPLALAGLAHGDNEALAPLGTALAKGEVAFEVEFLLDVGQSGHPSLVNSLQDGEDWAEEELSLAYAVARLQLGDASGEAVLRRAITGDDIGQRLEALSYLAELEHPAAEALLRKARALGPEVANTHAALALAARGRLDVQTILDAGQSNNAEIRALAVRFAGVRLSDAALVPKKQVKALTLLLEEALKDLNPEVRRRAVIGIHAAQLEGRESLLSTALQDDALGNRVQAAGAMLLARAQP